MKKLILSIAVVALFLLSAFAYIAVGSWKVAEPYAVKFSSKGPSGTFSGLKGDIIFDENNLDASKFDVSVDVNTISTGNGLMNKHAKGDSWFDAEKYPTIKFTSNKISKTSEGYKVDGTMDMHGIKKAITFPFTFRSNVFAADFDINRTDYGVGSTEGMSGRVATTLKVSLSVPVSK
jgi:polyisoprenoid-binding protein YceI